MFKNIIGITKKRVQNLSIFFIYSIDNLFKMKIILIKIKNKKVINNRRMEITSCYKLQILQPYKTPQQISFTDRPPPKGSSD